MAADRLHCLRCHSGIGSGYLSVCRNAKKNRHAMMLREAKKFFDSPLMSSVRDLRVYDHALLAALGRRRRRLGRRAFRLSRLLGRLPLRFLIIQKTATRRRHRRLLKGKAKRRQKIEMTQRNRQTHTRTRAHAYIAWALGNREHPPAEQRSSGPEGRQGRRGWQQPESGACRHQPQPPVQPGSRR